MSDKLNLIFFRMPEENSLVKELSIYYRNKEGYYVEFIDSGAEANQLLATEGHGILIFEVKTKLDLQNSVAILKAQRKAIKAGTIKPACILHVKNKKVEKILGKYGCQDLLDDDITAKTLSFKVDFWYRGLKTLLHKQEKEFELKKSRAKAQEVAKEVKSDFKLVEPLELKSDIWLLKANSDYKKILRRWLLRVLGPSPYVGNWVELEPQPGDRIPTWKFVTKNDDGQYILEDGAWFFSGSKPEFDWKVNRWNFSSEAPHLYFYTQDAQVFSRFKFEMGVVKIAENSQYALTKEQMILKSCDNKFNIEGDEAKDEESANIEGDSETDKLGGLLEGEAGDGEGDLGGHMSGKLGGGEDDGGGHYEGSGSTDKLDHGPLSGKGSTDQLSRDPLSGELKAQEKKPQENKRSEFSEEGDVGGHYGGKGSTDKLDHSPLGGKGSTDQLSRDPLSGQLKPQTKAAEGSNRSEFSEEDVGGHYGGKGSTDKLDHSPLGGKGSTDQLSRDPLSGQLKPQTKAAEGSNRSEFSEEDVGGHYGGKGSTDKLDHSPLGGKGSTDQLSRDPLSGELKAQEKKPQENKRSEFSEEDVGGHYGGKGSTDKLDHSPLGGKGSTDQLSRDPLSGQLKPQTKAAEGSNRSEFSEEDIGGHYSGEASTDAISRDPLNASEVNPFANDPELAKEIDDELSRAGLQALDKDGNPIPFSEVTQMTEEELSRAGIKVLDKDGKEIAPEAVAEAIDEELSRAGIHPIANDIQAKKKEIQENLSSSRTPVDNGVKDTVNSRKETHSHNQNLEAKTGKELWNNSAKKPVGTVAQVEDLDRDDLDVLAKKTIIAASKEKESFTSANPFGEIKISSVDARVSEMEDALGGGLTDSVDPIVGSEAQLSEDKSDLSTIFSGEADVDTESGDLKVILKQSTKAGNDITFICSFEDFYEDELVVVAPKDSLKEGSEVKAKVSLAYGGKKVVVYATGKIEEIEEYNEKKEMLVVSIEKIDSSLYQDFMSLYQDRQENIEDFMVKAKGLEGIDEAS